MRILPVALALFYKVEDETLKVWVQVREDDGPYHGLLEFPGGGIEAGETPLIAAVREVEEEVGLVIKAEDAVFMGTYSIEAPGKTVLLNVFLFPPYEGLEAKGQWLNITRTELSSPYRGKIPAPNHKIIDDLFVAKVR